MLQGFLTIPAANGFARNASLFLQGVRSPE